MTNPVLGSIRAIVFDAYGTLLSTGTGSLEAAKEILARNNRQTLSPHDFYGRWKELHREHIQNLDDFAAEETIFQADLSRLYQEYGMNRDPGEDVRLMLDTLGRREAFPETAEALAKLSGRYVIAIGSTTDTAPLLADLERNRLAVCRVFTSESLGLYKPRREFYETILKELGVLGEEALFVGDSLIDDVAGPKLAGMKTCWVNRKGRKVPSGWTAPDFEIAGLMELPDILEGKSV